MAVGELSEIVYIDTLNWFESIAFVVCHVSDHFIHCDRDSKTGPKGVHEPSGEVLSDCISH